MAAERTKATVCVTLDFDATSLWLMMGMTGARSLSRGAFGADTGAPRILDLCKRLKVPSTWFIPGHTADHYPDICAAVAADGHEIANHGYLHEDFSALTVDAGIECVARANDTLERVTGQRPRGMRFPGGDLDGELFERLVPMGFTYDSSLFGEYLPRWARGRDRIEDGGRIVAGPTLDLVEVPVTFMTSDFVHFEIIVPSPFPAAMPNPRQLEQVWRDQFDYLYEHVPGGVLMLMLHPQSIGWGARIAMLERFLSYCGEHADTRFATVETVADEFRAEETAARATGPDA